MARRKKGRDIDGVLLLDKPVGCSSNAALQRARRLFDARKAGHTGSLDPLASGLLPVCLGEATKVSSYLLHADKRYRVTAILGHETDTGDREGRPTRQSRVSPPARARIEEVIMCFIGEQQQVPPMYSALKQDGKRLYQLARQGREVERRPRSITVYAMELLTFESDRLSLNVRVSRGTYVRTLVEDMARAWGGAAHVGELRRTGVGNLDGRSMLSFERLADIGQNGLAALDGVLMPVSSALAHWPAVELDAAGVAAVRQGQVVANVACRPAGGWARIMSASGDFLGLGEIDEEKTLAPRRMFTRPLR